MSYVITHKDVELDLPKKYTLLKVGNNDCSRYDCCDSTGENISDKNLPIIMPNKGIKGINTLFLKYSIPFNK